MAKKRELSKDEKELLVGLMPESLKFASRMMFAGVEYDEIIGYVYELSGLEKVIRAQLLKRVSYYHLKNEAALVSYMLQNSSISCQDIQKNTQLYLQELSSANTPEYFEMSHSLEVSSNTFNMQSYDATMARPRISRYLLKKQLNKFLELLAPYLALAQEIEKAAPNVDELHRLIQLASKTKKAGMLFDERRLSQIQRIKSGITIIDLDGEITPEEMQIALKTDFSDDPEIFEEQVSLVQKSYNTVKDVVKAKEIKIIVYHYIEDTLHIWEHPSGTLLEFPFYGTTISQETFNFIRDIEDEIKKSGLNQMIFPHIRRLYEQINFGGEDKLNASEQRIVTLYKMFNPENETPSEK